MKTNMLNRDVSFFRTEKLGRKFWYNLYVRKRDVFQTEASFCSYEEILKKFFYSIRKIEKRCKSKIDKQLGKASIWEELAIKST